MGKKNKGPLPCDSCDRTFSATVDLEQHIRDKHHNLPTKAPTAQTPPPAPKPQVQTQCKPAPTSSATFGTIICEYCLATFTSSKDLDRHKTTSHAWRCMKCPTLPPFEDGAAWQVHFNKVHAASARTDKVADRKGKEVSTHSKEGKTKERSCGVDHKAITKVQSPRASRKDIPPVAKTQNAETLPESSFSGLSNVKNDLISSPPLEMWTSSVNQAQIASSTSSDDKAESQPAHQTTPNLEDQTASFDGRDLLSSQGSTLSLLVEIDPEPRRGRDEVTYEIASDTWSPAMTISSDGASEPGEGDIDVSPSDSSRLVNGSSQRKGDHIIVPPRVPKLGERESRNLAIVAGNYPRDEPNDQTQNGLDGATPSPTSLEQYERVRSDSPTSTTFSSRDEGRDTNQVPWSGDIPHDHLRARRSKPGWPEVHFECRICLSDPTPSTNLTATHCGHLFCYECIATEVLRTSRCPVCKNVLAVYCLFKLDVVS